MKKKKGFTLIELLAIIVILAVIVLITTPIVLKIIDDARLSTAVRSADGLKRASSLYYQTSQLNNEGVSYKTVIVFGKNNDGTGKIDSVKIGGQSISNFDQLKENGFEVDGALPTGGKLEISVDGTVRTKKDLIINGYYCKIPSKGVIDCKNGDGEPENDIETIPAPTIVPSQNPAAPEETVIAPPDDETIVSYCISTTNDADNCTFKDVVPNTSIVIAPVSTTPEVTPSDNYGPGTYYIFVKNADDEISAPAEYTIPGLSVEEEENATHLGIIYLNPTDKTANCTANNSVSTPGTYDGCMKWYIYSDDGENYKAILDHNTTPIMNWASSYTSYEQSDIKAEIDRLNGVWVSDSSYITGVTNLTVNEVLAIIEYPGTFNRSGWIYLDTGVGGGQHPTTQGGSNYAWLFDNTYNCIIEGGCNTSDSSSYPVGNSNQTSIGYWLDERLGYNDNVWTIVNNGSLNFNKYYGGSGYLGVRPVITVEKPKSYAVSFK